MSPEQSYGSADPPDDGGSWYVCRPGGAPQGPLSTDGVREAILRGILREDAQVCEALGEARTWRGITTVSAFCASLEGRGDVSLPLVYESGALRARGGDFEDPLSSLPTATWPRAKVPSPLRAPPPLLAPTPSKPAASPAGAKRGWWIVAALAGLVVGGSALAMGAYALGLVGSDPEAERSGTAAADAVSATAIEPSAAGQVPTVAASAAPRTDPPRAHPCEGSRTPLAICEWVAAVAEGRDAARPAFDQLQIFLLEEGFDRAKGRILGEGVSAGKSNTGESLMRYQATSSGVFGYCLQSRSTLAPGSFYTLWVRRHEGTSSIALPSGKTEECVLIEHEELPGTLTDLLQMPVADPELGATALRALSQIKAYDRAQ